MHGNSRKVAKDFHLFVVREKGKNTCFLLVFYAPVSSSSTPSLEVAGRERERTFSAVSGAFTYCCCRLLWSTEYAKAHMSKAQHTFTEKTVEVHKSDVQDNLPLSYDLPQN